MTAKRYMLDDGLIYDNGKEMEDVVDVLNEYAEENKKLKQENQRLNQTLENIQKELNKYNNEWVDL